uniref:Uncharacterized protein n=1 Tax=Cucumis melo TaxID=3656 RepID=A0A9I9DIT0_CUCME
MDDSSQNVALRTWIASWSVPLPLTPSCTHTPTNQFLMPSPQVKKDNSHSSVNKPSPEEAFLSSINGSASTSPNKVKREQNGI